MRLHQFLNILLTFAVVFATDEKITFENFKVYRILPETEGHVDLLHQLEQDNNNFLFWNGITSVNNSVDLMVSPETSLGFEKTMNIYGIKYSIFIENVQHLIDTENPREIIKTDSEFAFNKYHTLDEIYVYFEHLSQKYDVVQVIDAGKTTEGRSIKGVKISYKKENPGIFIEAGIHAREWITPATALYLINQLLTSKDKNIRSLAENRNWYIFPSFNPDGYVYTHTKNRLWRKTRSKKSALCPGVDANRNWGFKWMSGGASSFPCAETYAGSVAFSEPETKSMANYIKSISNELFAYISFHSYSQLLMFPYGHTKDHLDNYEEELSMGKKAIGALQQRYGTKYVTGNIAETIYIASGSSSDWVKGTLKLPVVFTYEFRDKGRYGFLLPANQIIPNGEEIVDSLIGMFDEAARFGYPKKS
ncbi:zinc carboxypeptidase-like [Leptopilina boulardi]|uniref:zinc carboxypeptidase-like n=1 Tax=Leptopilina boulardi TaxID=63433 RepID=UPI0021F60FAB|nr:zinc carboxypeptidase-like [Leptopilina boulardi]XP_051175445.1 zinc carboxypeptidase-like [Leptopilina boulardi]